jgi:drug/metabolite transporter (DMT)-like permease
MNPNVLGIAALFMWSSMTLLISMASSVPPFQLAALSWLIGLLVMGSYYAVKGEPVFAQFKRPVSDYVFVGTGVGGYTMLVYAAFYLAPPFEVHTINYLWPILLTVFLSVFQGEVMSKSKMLGFVLGFAGCIWLFVPRYIAEGFGGIGIGHVMALMGAVIWALYSCFAKTRDYPTGFMIPIFLFAFIICMIAHLLFEETAWPDFSVWVAVILLGGMRIAYVFWDYAIRQGNRPLLSSLVYFVPLFASIFMIIGGYGATSIYVYLATACIVAGCLIVNSHQILDIIFKRKIRENNITPQ